MIIALMDLAWGHLGVALLIAGIGAYIGFAVWLLTGAFQ